jgi:hypothetical protein
MLSRLLDLPARILNRIEPETNTGCWLWMGAPDKDGYGRYGQNRHWGGTNRAHRIVFGLLRGTVEMLQQQTLDHVCRVRCCVNPDHLRPASNRENILAPGSLALAKVNLAKTHCPRGHKYPEVRVRGERLCLECRRRQWRSYYVRHLDEQKARGRRRRARERAERERRA